MDCNIATCQEAFTKIKPFCDSLMRQPTEKAAQNVCDCLAKLPDTVLQNLMEYILLPPVIHLKVNALREELKLNLLNVIKELLSRAKIMKIEHFYELYIIFLRQVRDEKEKTLLINGHEELKLTVLTCIKYLFLRSSLDVIESIYTRENSLKLSESFFICINIARYEKYSVLRQLAVETLLILSHTHDEADSSDIVLRSQVADIVMLYFPGIIKGMMDTCEKSDTQNHNVTLMAVRGLGRVMALVMEDLPSAENSLDILTNTTENRSSDPLGMQSKLDTKNGMEQHLLNATRDQAWLLAASEKLNNAVKKLKTLTKHDHYKVRKELIVNVLLLLNNCMKNMNENLPQLIDIIIILSEDSVEEVRELAHNAFNQVHKKMVDGHGTKPIIEILEDSLYKLLTQLPRLMRTSDNAGQLDYLNQLIGYVRIFGKEHLSKVTNSLAHLRRLLLALVYVCELDCYEVSILNENCLPFSEDGIQSLEDRNWKKFKVIQDLTGYNKLVILCKLLGELGDVYTLVHSLFQLMLDIPHYQKELILLLNCICMARNPALKSLYPQIIERYTDFELWYLPIELQDDVPLRKVQSNILQICLLMEGLGIIATMLETGYQEFLLKTLYMIIERAGNKNRLIASVGLHVLKLVAKSQECTNLNSLIQHNVDYIAYHIDIKLHRIDRNVGVLDVITIVMTYSTLDFIPYLKATVEETLEQLQKTYQQHNSEVILKLLYTFVTCIGRQICNVTSEKSTEQIEESKDSVDEVIRYLLDYSKEKEVAREALKEDTDCDEDNTEVTEEFDGSQGRFPFAYTNNEDTQEKPPEHIRLVENIMKSSIHFVSSKKIAESTLSMQILYEGVKILSPWTEILLPVVHQLWHPLVDRFKEANMIIIRNAWEILYIVAQVSQDFVRARTLNQVIPSIAKFLETSSKESYKKDTNGPYTFTQMFKLQKLILDEFGSIAQYLKLQERSLCQLLTTTGLYLHYQQQPTLQQACVKLYKTVAHFNGDMVWVKCHSLIEDDSHDMKRHVKNSVVATMKNEDSEKPYKKNAEEVLNYIVAEINKL